MKVLDVVFLMRKDPNLPGSFFLPSAEANRHSLFYVLSGKAEVKAGEGTMSLEKGYLGFFSSKSSSEMILENVTAPFSCYLLTFELEDHDSVRSLLDEAFLKRFPQKMGAEPKTFFKDAERKFHQTDRPFRVRALELRVESFLYDLLGDLRSGLDLAPLDDPYEDTFNRHFEQALEILQSRVFSHVVLKEVCEELRISEEYLIRLFRKRLNMTPMKYLNNLKMESAASLLLSSDLSIKEISWKLGFASQYHFSRVFKTHTGKTPTEYRTEHFQGTVRVPR